MEEAYTTTQNKTRILTCKLSYCQDTPCSKTHYVVWRL